MSEKKSPAKKAPVKKQSKKSFSEELESLIKEAQGIFEKDGQDFNWLDFIHALKEAQRIASNKRLYRTSK
tara:strand:+ start:24 stop:233 length:210 start_codon:yes stop_codon:yes gene_type:complete